MLELSNSASFNTTLKSCEWKKILHAFEAFKLFRIKGFFVYEGKRYLLQGTPGEVRIIPMDGNQEGLVFIGNFSKEELKEYIHGKCD